MKDYSEIKPGAYYEDVNGVIYLLKEIDDVGSETNLVIKAVPIYYPPETVNIWMKNSSLYMRSVNKDDILEGIRKASNGKVEKLRMLGAIDY